MKTVLIIGAVCLLAAPALAGTVELGTASGGLMIYYNDLDVSGAGGVPDGVVSGYDENPANQAYLKFQFGYANPNGMGFQFDDTDLGGYSMNSVFSGQPVGSSQFGLDLQATAATYDGSGGVVIPGFDFVDNTDNTVAGAAHTNVIHSIGETAWAINDYKGAGSGPGNPAAEPINSLFRGTSFSFLISNFTTDGRFYSFDIAGTLVTDGSIHWYNPAFGTTGLASGNLGNEFLFEGSLTYDSYYAAHPWGNAGNTYTTGFENGSDQRDFYAGEITLYAQVLPLPGAGLMGFAALAGLGLVGAIRRRRARG